MSNLTESTQGVDMTEIDAPDESYFADYAEAAATPLAGGGSKLPQPGLHTVQFPDSFPDSCFTVRATSGGKRYLEILLDNQQRGEQGQGLRIVGGPADGYNARYIRVNNLPVPKFKREGGKATLDGYENADNATDILRNFGSTATPRSVEEWKEAFRALEGQVSPKPFYLTWEGRAKGNKDQRGYTRKLKKKDFTLTASDGSLLNYMELEAEQPFEMKARGVTKTVAPGEKYRVWANLTLASRGAAART